MTREEFIKLLDEEGCSYKIDGDKIFVIEHNIYLKELTGLPSGVVFVNRGSIILNSLTTIHTDVVFENDESVWLSNLESISPGAVFKNGGDVKLNNRWFDDWDGNIGKIDAKDLLNLMISKGIFER